MKIKYITPWDNIAFNPFNIKDDFDVTLSKEKWTIEDVDIDTLINYINKGYKIKINC